MNIGSEPFDTAPVDIGFGADEFAAFGLFDYEVQSQVFEARNWIGVRGYLGPGWKTDQEYIEKEQA